MTTKTPTTTKNPAAVAMGKCRQASMTAAERSKAGQRAALTRWRKPAAWPKGVKP